MLGGKRPGAGRKKGTPNKSNAERMAAIAATGETPMEYMLRVMRDPQVEHERRDRMAGQVAPYVHAKLASIEHAGPDGGAIIVQVVKFADYTDTGR